VVKKDRVVTKRREYSDTVRKPVNTYVETKMTEEELDAKVLELMASRGRRNTDPRDVLRQLEVLTKAARLHGPRKEIPVLMQQISNMLDSQRSIDMYLDHHQWRTCYRALVRVVQLLESSKKLVLVTMGAEELTDAALGGNTKLAAAAVGADGAAVAPASSSSSSSNVNTVMVVGSLDSFTVRMQDEYTKCLQQINPHTKVQTVFLFCLLLFLCRVCVARLHFTLPHHHQ
jgi:translation initiation factor 3 subunit C